MFRLLLGVVLGLVINRNAQPMPAPVRAAVVVAFAVGVLLAWRFGMRDKATAVAVAVAKAEAVATADAEARAQAIAQAAVHLHLNNGAEGSVLPAIAQAQRAIPALSDPSPLTYSGRHAGLRLADGRSLDEGVDVLGQSRLLPPELGPDEKPEDRSARFDRLVVPPIPDGHCLLGTDPSTYSLVERAAALVELDASHAATATRAPAFLSTSLEGKHVEQIANDSPSENTTRSAVEHPLQLSHSAIAEPPIP